MKRNLLTFFLLIFIKLNLLANLGNNSTVYLELSKPLFHKTLLSDTKSGVIWETSSLNEKKNAQYFVQLVDKTGDLLLVKNVELSSEKCKIQSSHKMISDGKN